MTSCFSNYKDSDGVSIALYSPLWFKGEKFLGLAPLKQTFFDIKSNKIDRKEYEKQYREQVLNKLNASEIYHRFKDNVLLCWERPTYENGKIVEFFCHRRIFALWMKEQLDIEVKEYDTRENINNIKLF
jgi:hypothetical protein